MIRFRSALIDVVVVSLVFSLLAAVGTSVSEAAGTRTELAAAELRQDQGPAELVDNSSFLPAEDAGPPRHSLDGTLTVPRSPMQLGATGYSSYRFFPGFSAEFFTHDEFLVPANRSIILNPGNWSLILSPGRVWSEPGDDHMSRASLPFVLGSPPDRQYTGGETHNGVATFLFDDEGVSSFRFQVTQETAPDGDIFDMWGQLPLEYEPGQMIGVDELRSAFEREIAGLLPVRPWADLEEQVGADVLASFTAGLEPDQISAAGIVLDGTIYQLPSWTRHGDYPFPRFMQHSGMSVSKSIGAGIAMLWLAEEYGQQVFQLPITDYLDVTADHDGWDEVTFGDVLDMATGVGDNAPQRRPFDVYANETGQNYRRFFLAGTTSEKLKAILAAPNYPWGPGELLRYTSSQTFLLSAAMDAYLKTQEGPDAALWERLQEEVFNPIGVHHMTMMHTSAGDSGPGTPLMSSGLRLTIDDLAKISILLQNEGVHDGEQLLNAAAVRDALYRTGQVLGLPSGKAFADGDQAYHASFWSLAHRAENGQYFQVPFMSGAGGITVFLAPNRVTTFVFTDAGQDSYSLNIPRIAEELRPYPGEGLDGVSLIADKSSNGSRLLGGIVVATLALGAAAVWLNAAVRKRRASANSSTLGE